MVFSFRSIWGKLENWGRDGFFRNFCARFLRVGELFVSNRRLQDPDWKQMC